MHLPIRSRQCIFLLLLLAAGTPAATAWAWDDDARSEGWYPNDEVGWVNLDLGYRGDLAGGITQASQGFFLELGFNVARFFNSATIVAPYIGISPQGNNQYAAGFQEDINRYYQVPAAYQELVDRQAVQPLTEAEEQERIAYLAGDGRLSLLRSGTPEGTVDFYYGLAIRYPHRYAPVVKLYSFMSSVNMGSGSTGFYEVGGQGPVQGANPFELYGWGAEVIVFRGYTLLGAPEFGNFEVGFVSLFYEQIDMSQAVIYPRNDVQNLRQVYLREFMRDGFLDRWGKNTLIGIKIGLHVL